jgi:Flp pilus assembly protein TadG
VSSAKVLSSSITQRDNSFTKHELAFRLAQRKAETHGGFLRRCAGKQGVQEVVIGLKKIGKRWAQRARKLFGPEDEHAAAVGPVRRFWRSKEEGSALVEMAVTLPVVMLIMTGLFSFSIALYQKLLLSEAISVGGRMLAVDRGDTDPCKTIATAIYANAPGLTQANINLTFVLNGVSTNAATCPGTSGAANSNMVAGQAAQIQATYPCTFMVYSKSFAACSMQTVVTEVVQ